MEKERKNKRNEFKSKKGITLVALVVTIIILLILAGISIVTLTGSGLFEKAKLAEQDSKNAQDRENSTLSQYENIMNSYLTETSKNEETNKPNEEVDIPTVEIQESHTIKTLTYSWEELEQIANIISDNDDTITNETLEVQITIGEKVYTVGVGDSAVVRYNGTNQTVRLMGFNHDILTDSAAYGEGKNNTYAGISFEFIKFITSAAMNSSRTNSTGWGGSALRKTLNSEAELNKLGNISQIKQVNKTYVLGKSTTTKTSQDKIWLLACSEVWDNANDSTSVNVYGSAKVKEGEQYKYYKNIDPDANAQISSLVKGSTFWWFRSASSNSSEGFCGASYKGVSGSSAATASYGVAPGFCI